MVLSLFRVILNDFDFRTFVEINDLRLGYPDERFGREVVLVADDGTHETIYSDRKSVV